jgi:hypothetical protein
MALHAGYSRRSIEQNVRIEKRAGKGKKKAVAIALATARRARMKKKGKRGLRKSDLQAVRALRKKGKS